MNCLLKMSSTSNHSNQKDPNANTIKLNQKYAFYYRKTEDSNQTQSKQPLDKVEYESQVKKYQNLTQIKIFGQFFNILENLIAVSLVLNFICSNTL